MYRLTRGFLITILYMKDRIKQIMENEELTSARFADRLDINRAVISHILNGRNNPSLDVVTKILSEMKYINPEWLLNGTGKMYKDGMNKDKLSKNDLFDQHDKFQADKSVKTENRKELALNPTIESNKVALKESLNPILPPAKKISQIIIYYDDNTFEIFT